MNKLTTFDFLTIDNETLPVRVITDDNGELLFVGKDAAESLEYKDTVNAIKQHCRGVAEYHPIQDSLGREQNVRVIREPDLYRLIAGSTLPVRVITDDSGDMLFVAKDVCESLEYKDPTTAVKSHCRGVQELHPILDSLGRTQKVRVIREPDLYRLIAGSTLPSAERFEKWLFEEVLPAIRKTGSYTLPNQRPHTEAMSLSALAINAAKAFGFEGNQAVLSANNAVRYFHWCEPAGSDGAYGAPRSRTGSGYYRVRHRCAVGYWCS